MKKILLIAMLILSLTLCCGCFDEETSSDYVSIEEYEILEGQVEELESLNEILEDEVEELEQRVYDLENIIWGGIDPAALNY